jgi:pyruvate-ferredoxin/flavodoxin oxidoreductase
VLASGRNFNILVLDTEICSSCGGQVTKSTPCGVVGKFAARGKESRKRDLGRAALGHAGVYVAQVALGANPQQAIRAFREAEAHEGPSLILAYCPCVAHGFNLKHGPRHQAMAVHSGHWPLFRYHPGLPEAPRLRLDCLRPSLPFKKFAYSEVRYNLLPRTDPERSKTILARCKQDVAERWAFLEALATPPVSPSSSRKE